MYLSRDYSVSVRTWMCAWEHGYVRGNMGVCVGTSIGVCVKSVMVVNTGSRNDLHHIVYHLYLVLLTREDVAIVNGADQDTSPTSCCPVPKCIPVAPVSRV